MTIEHDDDLLLSSLGAGSSAPPGDELAGLLAAWRADIDAQALPEPLPPLRPATERDRPPLPVPLPVQRRRPFRRTSGSTGPSGEGPGRGRAPRPLVVALAAAVLAFGGLAVASASAQPGTPLWPITRVIFGDTAKSRVAAQEAEKLLDQARAAIMAGDKVGAAKLVEAARVQIGQIGDSETRRRLTGEADGLWGQILVMPLSGNGSTASGGPVPSQSGQPGTPTPTPTAGGGIIPPLPTLSLPPLPTISLPIIG